MTENTPFVIEYYRENTMSEKFVGDTVINSFMDLLAMVLGFVIAYRSPVWLTLLLFIGMEVMTVLVIRDGFLLNVLMLLYPIESIKEWQMQEAALLCLFGLRRGFGFFSKEDGAERGASLPWDFAQGS